jgi:LmbE family N-acetylglucosaminyl deacetylase
MAGVETGALVSVASLFSAVGKVLAVGAHPDDIEIGCGATLRLLERVNPAIDIRFLVLTGNELRRAEAEDSAKRYLREPSRLTMCRFRDGYVPYEDPVAVKEALVAHSSRFEPDIVFAPRPDDAHQDHSFVGRLVGQVFRSQLLLHYEITKYDGDLGVVNVYVPVSADDVDAKISDLYTSFPSQTHRPWFDDSTFRGLTRVRGVEARSESGYAEGFWCPKLILS